MKSPKTREDKVKFGKGWQRFKLNNKNEYKNPCNLMNANTGTLQTAANFLASTTTGLLPSFHEKYVCILRVFKDI